MQKQKRDESDRLIILKLQIGKCIFRLWLSASEVTYTVSPVQSWEVPRTNTFHFQNNILKELHSAHSPDNQH